MTNELYRSILNIFSTKYSSIFFTMESKNREALLWTGALIGTKDLYILNKSQEDN